MTLRCLACVEEGVCVCVCVCVCSHVTGSLVQLGRRVS